MPKTVDHDHRRAQISEAVVHLAARHGLHAVTMRAAATETGFSLRLVQYYFPTKAALIHGVLDHLRHRSDERWKARTAALPRTPTARAYVDAFLDEALPTDDDSRAFHLVGASYAVLAMTDPDFADAPVTSGLHHLEDQLADVLHRGQQDGELPEHLDPACEAARLVALNHGLGTTVLIGHRTAEQARTVQRYHVDALFHPR